MQPTRPDPSRSHADPLEPSGRRNDASIPHLVAEVYEAAPPAVRRRVLEQLVRPMGLLSLVAVADGVFAGMRLRSGWQELQIRIEDLPSVHASHVIALTDYAEQVSVEIVDGLVQALTSSPLLTGTATAALVALLVRRARLRQVR